MARRPAPFALTVLCFGAVLASSSGCSAPAQSNPGYGPCLALIELPPSLLTPASGATGVPLLIGALVVGNGPSDGEFELAPGSAAPARVGPIEAVPTPAASASSTYQPGSVQVRIPALAPATTYTLTYVAAAVPSGSCQYESSGAVGTFTTTS